MLLIVGTAFAIAFVAIGVAVSLWWPTNLGGPVGVGIGAGKVPKHGFFGIQVESPEAPLTIKSAVAGSGADKAGLRPKDVVLAIGSEIEPDLAAMQRVAEAASPGAEVPVTIRRDENEIQLSVRLMSFAEMAQLQANAMREADVRRAKNEPAGQ